MTMPLSAAPDFTATEVVGNGGDGVANGVIGGVASAEAPTRQQPPQQQASPSVGESFMAPARSPYQEPPPPQSGSPGQPLAVPHSPHTRGAPRAAPQHSLGKPLQSIAGRPRPPTLRPPPPPALGTRVP